MALGRSPEYHWNQIISKSVHWFSRRSRLKLFSIWWPFCSMERNHLSNFGRGLAKEHFREIISKSVHRFSSRSCLKLFFYL